MNISTYEARIAALEAQLGPGPGPVQETGLVSMKITPDILLTDGTTLNEKLNTLLPKVSGTQNVSYETTADQIPVTDTFNVELVPGSEWYALNGFDESHEPTFGEKGANTSVSFTPYNEGNRELILHVAGIAASNNNSSDPSFTIATLIIQINAPLL